MAIMGQMARIVVNETNRDKSWYDNNDIGVRKPNPINVDCCG
jgi:hypothetical protein